MSSKPGTSSQTTCADEEKKSRLLHEALTKASAVRASKRMQAMQSYGTTICLEPESSSTSSQLTDVELIKCHPLMPVLQLLCEKCGDATHTMQPRAFQMNDVCQEKGQDSDDNKQQYWLVRISTKQTFAGLIVVISIDSIHIALKIVLRENSGIPYVRWRSSEIS
ncbi:hypothetical protein RB195_021854 [Necator americanus]|uniref:MEIS N-terminal domain-containing protein n=1 Tax=Necator americanus TaxID=51031 RepID=A0ABR1ECY5_NECAM